jgi:hypothetical protein
VVTGGALKPEQERHVAWGIASCGILRAGGIAAVHRIVAPYRAHAASLAASSAAMCEVGFTRPCAGATGRSSGLRLRGVVRDPTKDVDVRSDCFLE